MGKIKLTLTVDEEVVRKSKAAGLNISKVCENALIDLITCIDNSKNLNLVNAEANSDKVKNKRKRALTMDEIFLDPPSR